MKRDQFEHTIRAAGSILGEDSILIIGSQAIYASIDYPLPEAERSIEVDISSLHDDDGARADLIDGSIGELSVFQDTFGYYAQGVTPQTAILPAGWRNRLVPYKTTSTHNIVALCLDPHDLWISKAIAGRPKDREFCEALLTRNLVRTERLRQLVNQVEGLNTVIEKQVLGLIHDEL